MKKLLISIAIMFVVPIFAFAQEINVVFSIDNNYPLFTMLAINSILQNNDSNSHYNFYIVENNVTEKNKARMEKYVIDRGQSIEFINIDTSVIDDGKTFTGFNPGHITKIAMARILLPDLLPKNIHRVIYLDSDICVFSDLKELYNADLGDNLAGLVLDREQTYYLDKFSLKNGYYNSGVIVIDLDKWRKANMVEQLLLFVKNNRSRFVDTGSANFVFKYPDQDLINILLNGKIKSLPKKWNTFFNTIPVVTKDVGIVHYIGPIKPWHYPADYSNTYRAYYKSWNSSGLWWYKHYYALKGIKKYYLDICEYRKLQYIWHLSYLKFMFEKMGFHNTIKA